MIQPEAYATEQAQFISRNDPRNYPNALAFQAAVSEHMWEFCKATFDKRDRQAAQRQTTVYHTFMTPMKDPDPMKLRYGDHIKITEQDLPAFCKKFKLDEAQMRLVSEGKLLKHRGFYRSTHIGGQYYGHIYIERTPVDPGAAIKRKRSEEHEKQRMESMHYKTPVAGKTLVWTPETELDITTEPDGKNRLVSILGLF